MNKFQEFWAKIWRLTRGDCLNCGCVYDFLKEPGIPLLRTPDDEWEIPICGNCQRNASVVVNKERILQKLRESGYNQSDLDSARSRIRKFLGENTVIQFPKAS